MFQRKFAIVFRNLLALTAIMSISTHADTRVESELEKTPSSAIEQEGVARNKLVVRESFESKDGEFEVVALDQAESPLTSHPMVCSRKKCSYLGKTFLSKSDVSVSWSNKNNFTITNAFGELILGEISKNPEIFIHFRNEDHVWLATLHKIPIQKGTWELEYTPSPWVETLVAFVGLQSMQTKPHWRNRALIAGGVLTALAIAGKAIHSRYYSTATPSSGPLPPAPVDSTPIIKKQENVNNQPSSSSAHTRPKLDSSSRNSPRPRFHALPNNPLYDLKRPLSDAAKKHFKATIGITDSELNMLDKGHKEFRQIYLDGIPGNVIPREELRQVLSALYFDSKLVLLLQDESVLGQLYDLNQDKTLDAEALMQARMKCLQDAMDGFDREEYVQSRLKNQPKMAHLFQNGLSEDIFPLASLQKAMQENPAEFTDEVADFFNDKDELNKIKNLPSDAARLKYILKRIKNAKGKKLEETFFKRVPEVQALLAVGFQEDFISKENFRALILANSSEIESSTIQEIFVETNLDWIRRNSQSPKEAEEELVRQIKLQHVFKKVPNARKAYMREFPAEIIPGPEFRQFMSDHSALITQKSMKVFSEGNLNKLVQSYPDQVNAEKELLRQLKLASKKDRSD